MTKKTQKTTPTASKAAPVNRRKASTRTPLATVSTASHRRSGMPPPVEPPALAAPPGNTGLAPARGRAKRPAAAPRRRVVSTAPVSTSHVIRPAPAVEVPALPTVIAAQTPSGPEPAHDEIATRAYFISLDRGGDSGNAEQDWVAAQSELRQERELNGRRPQD
jgi:hypothetical protein